MAGAPSMLAKSCSSLASGSLQAQPAPGDSEVSRGAWSTVTLATVAVAASVGGHGGYQAAVTVRGFHGTGVNWFPRRIPTCVPYPCPK